jgi:predicted ABC-type ATPase
LPDPVLHLLAGPNGSGKTTLFREVIEPATGLEWVNADEIAAEQGDRDDPQRAYRAAQLAAEKRTQLIQEGRSFATETVFSHPSKVDLVREAVGAGYLVTLHVVVVPEELAVARVESRVEHGGHDVPEDKIRGRYTRLWAHVVDAVALAHQTFVYDNSRADQPYRVVATFEQGQAVGTPDWPQWTPEELRGISTG